VFVFALTAVVIPAVAEFVFALITAASDVDAVPTLVSVFEFTAVVTPETSDCVASEPESRPAPVSVRDAYVHTSAATEPIAVKVRDEYVQIAPGSVAKREDEAVEI
jgi:hypothetical protein